jgi:hypothetical protein
MTSAAGQFSAHLYVARTWEEKMTKPSLQTIEDYWNFCLQASQGPRMQGLITERREMCEFVKNLGGFEVFTDEPHKVKLAKLFEFDSVLSMCSYLSGLTGEPVGVIDLVLMVGPAI